MLPTLDVTTHEGGDDSISQARRSLLERLGLMHEKDVCLLLNLKPETLWTWRRDRRGPSYVKLGREVAYRVEDLMAWISDNLVLLLRAPMPELPASVNDNGPALAEPEAILA